MKIVQVCPYDLSRFGGVQSHIASLSVELSRRGHEVMIITPRVSGATDHSVHGHHGICVETVGRGRLIRAGGTRFEATYASAAQLRSLKVKLDKWGADVVHYHTILSPVLPGQIFKILDGPSVATFHATPPAGITGSIMKLAGDRLAARLASGLDVAIAVSDSALSALRTSQAQMQTYILPPATDLSPYLALERPGAAARSEFLNILSFGRLEPRKGIDTLLKAWQGLDERLLAREAVRRPVLSIAGEGPLETAVRSAANSPQYSRLTHVPAPDQPGLLRLLSAADLVVAPAKYGESFGIVLAESMASGVPVLAADNSGYRDVLKNDFATHLYPAGDTDALADRIVELCCLMPDDNLFAPERYRSFAAQFDIKHWAGQFEKCFRRAIETRPTC